MGSLDKPSLWNHLNLRVVACFEEWLAASWQSFARSAQRSRPGSCLFPPQCVSASSRTLWQGKSQAAPARTICGPSTKSGQVKEESEEVAGTSPVVFFLLLFFVVHRTQHPPRRTAHLK